MRHPQALDQDMAPLTSLASLLISSLFVRSVYRSLSHCAAEYITMELSSNTDIQWAIYLRKVGTPWFAQEQYMYDPIRNIVWAAIRTAGYLQEQNVAVGQSVPAPDIALVTRTMLERTMSDALAAGRVVGPLKMPLDGHRRSGSGGSSGTASSSATYATGSSTPASSQELGVFSGQPDLAIYQLYIQKDLWRTGFARSQLIYMIMEVKKSAINVPWGRGPITVTSDVSECAQLTMYAILTIQQNDEPVALVCRWTPRTVWILAFYSRRDSLTPTAWNDVKIWFIKKYEIAEQEQRRALSSILIRIAEERVTIARVRALFNVGADPTNSLHSIFSGGWIQL